MFQTTIVFVSVIAVVSLIELSTQQQKTEIESYTNRNDASNEKLKEDTLGAARRGDIDRFRKGVYNGGLKAYANIFKNFSYLKRKEIYNAMENKMFTIERLMDSNLVVPAKKDRPDRYDFNVTLLQGTNVITELSLNLKALERWESDEKPLHMICSLPEVEPRVIKYLLEKGLNINERSEWNDTPLQLAAFHGNLALVKFLVENGADPASSVQFDQKEYKLRNYHRLVKVFSPNDLIIPNGSKIQYNALVSAIAGGHKEIVKYLINIGTDVNMKNQSSAALFYPVLDGNTDMIEILLKNGCDVNGRDVMGTTALHMAADSGKLEIARLLLSHGANVAAIDNYGWTPLHVAAFSSHNIGLVELLIKAGALADVTTDRGFTTLILAEAGSSPSFLSCLRPAIASNFSKNISCQRQSFIHRNNIYIIALLCNRNVNVKHKDEALGWSALHWAHAIGDETAAKLLVEKCGASDQAWSNAGLSPPDVAKYFGNNL